MTFIYTRHEYSVLQAYFLSFFFIRMITKICTLQTSLLKKTIIHCIRIYIKTVRFIFSGKKNLSKLHTRTCKLKHAFPYQHVIQTHNDL